MKFFRQAALCAAILGSLVGSALAQGLGSAASISASGTSAAVALPLSPASTNYKSVIIAPAAGTSVEIFYALGRASAAASATPGTVAAAGSTPSAALPSGGICLNMGSYTNVAAITGGSAATVRITQINGCTQFAGGGGSSGGGSTTANQGTAAAASGAWPFYGTVGGTALSATNGWWTNILQGNAVLSATNGLFVAPTTAASWGVTGTFWPYSLGQGASAASVPSVEASDSPLIPFAANPVASITRSGNTTTYTINTGWNNGTPTFFSFTGACRVNGGQVLIPTINIWSSANPTLKLTGILWLFAGVPGTNVSDNATFTIAAASGNPSTGDFSLLTGSKQGFPFTLGNAQISAGAANSSTTLSGTNYQAKCASGTTTITGMVEVTNAYIPANAEVLSVGLNTIGAN